VRTRRNEKEKRSALRCCFATIYHNKTTFLVQHESGADVPGNNPRSGSGSGPALAPDKHKALGFPLAKDRNKNWEFAFRKLLI
jgi:hypothetical protein